MIDIVGIPQTEPLRIIIGAGRQSWPGWIATDQKDLDLLNPEDWEQSFKSRPADAFLSEYVWEHLTESEGRRAASLCYKWLKPGGYLRCAVPDGYFPDKYYRQLKSVGGFETPLHSSAGYRVVYNYKLLSDVFMQAGFDVELLEFCDEGGRFHYHQWSADDGPIYRSLMLDWRNQRGKIVNASLIIDAKKRISAEKYASVKQPISLCKVRRLRYDMKSAFRK